jgi:hypothetical protein
MNKIKRLARSTFFVCVALFAATFALYLSNIRYIGTTDTVTNEIYAENFEQTGRTYLTDNFSLNLLVQPVELPEHAKNTMEIDGKFYSKYPPATPVISYPFYKAFDIVGIQNHKLIGKVTAAFLTAFSIPVLFLVLKRFTQKKNAFFIALIYAIASSTWAISSQALWQHTYSQFFSIMLLYLLSFMIVNKNYSIDVTFFKGRLKFDRTKFYYALFFTLGVLMGINIAIRPTNILTAFLLGLLVLCTKDLRKILFTVLGGLLPTVAFFAYNYTVFGSPMASGYGAEASAGWNNPFLTGFIGLLVSPSVGILVFSPIFIFAFVGIFMIIKERIKNFDISFSKNNLFLASILVFIVNLLLYANWWAWHGDSWVYRMIIDGLPYLSLAFIPVFELFLFKRSKTVFDKILTVVVGVLFLFSAYVQALGAYSDDYSWHSRYKVTYKDHDYLFDIKNSRLMYLIMAQKYYVQLPHRTVYVVGDTFGDTATFVSGSYAVGGDDKIMHALFLNTGRNPELTDSGLAINQKYEGMSFFMARPYIGEKVRVTIDLVEEKTAEDAVMQIRELRDGKQVKVTALPAQSTISYILENSAEEIRVQNDASDDEIMIRSVRLEVVE